MKLFILILLAGILTLPSCTKNYQEINQNPNAITAVTPNLLLPGIIRSTTYEILGQSWGIGNIVMQHTAKIQFVSEDRYIWNERNGVWNNMYNNLRDVQILIAQSEQLNAPNYRGAALILRAWMFSLLTDCYGNVPYSETLAGGTLTPKYDSQEEIYNGILADLATANSIMSPSAGSIVGDLVYGGNVSKWRKLANSLRLRYLMRISDKKNVSAEMQAIINDPVANPIFTDPGSWAQGATFFGGAGNHGDNAVIEYLEAAPNQYYLYTTRQGSFDEFRLSKTLGDTLLKFTDPRLQVFAQFTDTYGADNGLNPASQAAPVVASAYVGVPNGLNEVDALEYNGGSGKISRVGHIFYKGSSETQKGLQGALGYIMGYPELQFILAEAVKKGLVNTGKTAQEHYEEGIKGAFIYACTTIPGDYLTRPGVAYNEADALKLIGTQKWISLFFTGLEAWFDWRRTGYPALIAGRDNVNDDKIPVRFIYPINEQNLNGASRDAAVAAQGPDNYNTKVWWDN
ncbi:MAG: SusD/RagB family nutrient-binding outer membrane lipoprotein [Chitinophagaceae bacterium]|nr:SusD/RagB family nutrient-binding outer membrane lipoprotein [Chitinophagaceae bacterium]MCW5929230.1 SusD/RagB family nutrient-binding outer membrane lipoprotein [Chitinophagaceae bacterium]